MIEQLTLIDSARLERERIRNALAQSRQTYLATVRSFLRLYALEHGGEASVDDAYTAIERHGFFTPADLGFDNRCFGSLFKSEEWRPVRQVATRRAEVVARVGRARSFVTVYRLTGYGC